jgi:protein-L-isoaspartate(D-aspartate) O-methyltransferase
MAEEREHNWQHNRTAERAEMVARQIESRGITDPGVLWAMREVPREAFLPEDRRDMAYIDAAIPIAQGQTMSQPFIVALMAASLQMNPGDKVLEVGTGSGYAAAIMSRIALEVYTIERHQALAESARRILHDLGYANIHIGYGDGTMGWQANAPYDAISVAASGPQIPDTLLTQLRVGGRLVMPVGSVRSEQRLVRITRVGEREFRREDLGPVAFVPLIGREGWGNTENRHNGSGHLPNSGGNPISVMGPPHSVAHLIAQAAEPFPSVDEADLTKLLERIGDSRVVLIGEATHGTSEFYLMRQRITAELIKQKGFTIVAAEADWPDALRVDRYVRGASPSTRAASIFSRFPNWMWRNREVLGFVEWLREWNAGQPPHRRAGFYGLDLYSLSESIHEVLHYLNSVDPDIAKEARARYECLYPYWTDPAEYGHAAITGRMESCEEEVVGMLTGLLKKRLDYSRDDGDEYFEATRNAAIVTNAEKYYRIMYYGSAEWWNLRDQHMFDTLGSLLQHHGPQSKAVVWAHNSHVGDADATEMSARGEINIGNLVRRGLGAQNSYIIGFGTHDGTVAAAHNWGAEVQVMQVRPSNEQSYERLCHDSAVSNFLLPLHDPQREIVRSELSESRLERAIGVIYRPQTELQSHYFQAILPEQFDEYIWLDRTQAITPLGHPHAPTLAEGHPFALLDE